MNYLSSLTLPIPTPPIIIPESKPNLDKGKSLAKLLKDLLPVHQYKFMIDLAGDEENFVYFLGQGNLTREDILNQDRLSSYVSWVAAQNPNTRRLLTKYDGFTRRYRRHNPIDSIDDVSLPIVQRSISDMYRTGTQTPARDFRRLGFGNVLKREGGMLKIIIQTNPELLYNLSLPGK